MNKNAKNLIGMQFGRLTVIERDYSKSSDRGIYWIVKCTCGNTKSIRSRSMTIGKVISCGCYSAELTSKRQTLPNNQAALNKLYATYLHSADRRNYLFDIPQIDFQNLIQQNCHYCNAAPYQNYRTNSKNCAVYNGLDRVDNAKGYTLDNVVPCCGICNRAKDTMTLAAFEAWVERIYNHTHKQNI